MSDLITYMRYIRHLLNKRRPKLVILDVAGSCNASCCFCPRRYMPQERRRGFMTKELFEDTLHDLRRLNIKQVRLYSTAEPLLHPDFDYIINRLKQESLHVTVSTNASFLDKHKEALLLVDHLQYSVEGWDEPSYEFFRKPLRFKRIHREIRGFYSYAQSESVHPHITMNLLLTKQTNLKTYLDIWGEYADSISVNFMTGVTRYKDGRFITETPEELNGYLFPYQLVYTNGCSYPFDVLTVAYDGKIALCCEDFAAEQQLGSVSQGISRVFNADGLRRIRSGFLHGTPLMCQGCGRFRRPLPADVFEVERKVADLCHPCKSKLELNV